MYTLILLIYVGMLSDKDSVAITSIPFPNQQLCEQAGQASKKLVQGTTKAQSYVCVKSN